MTFLYSLIHARGSVLAPEPEKKTVRFTSFTEFTFKCKHSCFDFSTLGSTEKPPLEKANTQRAPAAVLRLLGQNDMIVLKINQIIKQSVWCRSERFVILPLKGWSLV